MRITEILKRKIGHGANQKLNDKRWPKYEGLSERQEIELRGLRSDLLGDLSDNRMVTNSTQERLNAFFKNDYTKADAEIAAANLVHDTPAKPSARTL